MQKEKQKVHPLLLFVALFRKSALKQRIKSAVFPRRVRVRLLHHNPRPKKMQMWKRKRVKGIRSTGAKFCWCDRWMERNDRSQVSIIKRLKQCNLQNLLVLNTASCSTTKQQIKSGLSSVTQWETHSICMIYLLRQMKSVSAHSSIRGKEKKGSSVSSSGGKCNLNQIWFCHNLFFPPSSGRQSVPSGSESEFFPHQNQTLNFQTIKFVALNCVMHMNRFQCWNKFSVKKFDISKYSVY